MTTLPLGRSASLPDPDQLRQWADRNSFALRTGVALVAVVAAYHYSLSTLLSTLGLETPLAYLGLVPFMALGIIALKARPLAHEPDLHDRQIDVLVAVPLLLAAVGMVLFLPDRLDTLFWVWRVDLLSLPLFAAGTIALLFGVRALWRVRIAVGFLALAWPLPWVALLDRWLDSFTDLTIAVTGQFVEWIPVASRSAGGDGSLFTVVHDGTPFQLSVASACSGVNSVVGFLLVGIAGMALVRGKRLPKAAWLLGGVLLLWGLNIARLIGLFWAGQTWGERFAVDGLHPVIGLVLFVLGILVMALVMPRMGLTLPEAAARRGRSRKGAPADAAPAVPVVPHHRRAVPTARAAVLVLLALALVMGVANSGMKQYGLFADGLGEPRLVSFEASTQVPGWSGAQTDTYDWSRRFFGGDSTWHRYAYSSTALSGMTVDIVSTSKLGRLSAYGIEACYRFHGYDPTRPVDVDLGGGVKGQALSYTDPDRDRTWQVLSWVWPVTSPEGTRYERVTLLAPTTKAAPTTGQPVVRPASVGGSSGSDSAQVQTSQRNFAEAVISSRASVPTSAETRVDPVVPIAPQTGITVVPGTVDSAPAAGPAS